jgi:hypothetical protein
MASVRRSTAAVAGAGAFVAVDGLLVADTTFSGTPKKTDRDSEVGRRRGVRDRDRTGYRKLSAGRGAAVPLNLRAPSRTWYLTYRQSDDCQLTQRRSDTAT